MKNTDWNEKKVRSFLEKLKKVWGAPFDYEIRMCYGNFISILHDDILYFSNYSNSMDDTWVKMRLIYLYLTYSKNRIMVSVYKSKGEEGVYQALLSFGEGICNELGLSYISLKDLYDNEKGFFENQDAFQRYSSGDRLLSKVKYTLSYTVKSVENYITVECNDGELLLLDEDEVRNNCNIIIADHSAMSN